MTVYANAVLKHPLTHSNLIAVLPKVATPPSWYSVLGGLQFLLLHSMVRGFLLAAPPGKYSSQEVGWPR